MRRVGAAGLVLLAAQTSADCAANATADARVFAQSSKLQCPGIADVPMPCAWDERRRPRVFHLHISKMAGREVLSKAPAATGLAPCAATSRPGARATFRGGFAPPAAPCLTSYEATWDDGVAARGRRAEMFV